MTVLFCQKGRLDCDPVLKLNGATLLVKQDKFLGITFDTKLNFLAHINTINVKANRALNILKVLSHEQWVTTEHVTYVFTGLMCVPF